MKVRLLLLGLIVLVACGAESAPAPDRTEVCPRERWMLYGDSVPRARDTYYWLRCYCAEVGCNGE